jgi:hypothetical protein
MPVSYEDKIKEQAQPYLEAGEQVLAAVIQKTPPAVVPVP